MIDDVHKRCEMIQRHLEVLSRVVEQEPIGIVALSNETTHAHHEVRYSLRVLEEEELIKPTQQGARTTERTSAFVADLDERSRSYNHKSIP